jgi:nucleotide-binding universal stress UspA family protein
LDFTSASEQELTLATQICQRLGAKLVLQHNVDDMPPLALAAAWMYDEEHIAEEAKRNASAERRLQEVFGRLPPSFAYEARITHGPLDQTVLHLAGQLPADLIVMGTHGPSTSAHTSHTDTVLAHASCPVLTLRESSSGLRYPDLQSSQKLQTALVPIDFTDHSLRALEYVFALLEVFPLKLHLLHVESSLAWSDVCGMLRHLSEHRLERLGSAEERLATLVPLDWLSRVTVQARMGDVAEEILDEAFRIQARLVIMGAHPKNVVDKLIFGANSLKVLHRSPCPVWLIPAAKSHEVSHTLVTAEHESGRTEHHST